MTGTQQVKGGTGDLVKRLLRQEASRRFDASVGRLADRASGALTRATGTLTDVADNGGRLPRRTGPRAGGRLSPVAALAGLGPSALSSVASGKARTARKKVSEAVGGGDSAEEDDAGEESGEGGSGEPSKAGPTKVTSIIEVADVGKPLRTVYDRWTQYEDFSEFTKGVQSVTKSDDTSSDWKVKIAFSNRSFSATVQEQVPDERIVWTSEGAKGSTHGAVSFHELGPALTRIVAVVEYYPSGFFEKTGNLWRAQGRRLRLDLKHFVRFVTLQDEEAEGWRGEIREGEVVRTHEEAIEDEAAEGEDEDEAGGDDGAYEDGDGADEEAYEDEDEEEEDAPADEEDEGDWDEEREEEAGDEDEAGTRAAR